MRRKRKAQLFVYVLCVALLATLGMQMNNPDSSSIGVQSPQASYLTIFNNELLSPPNPQDLLDLQAFAAPESEKSPSVHIASYSAADLPENTDQFDSDDSAAAAISTTGQPETEATPDDPAIPVYEVTAHYLNIRSDSNADSEIINVVKQGTLLEVSEAIGNGWIALRNGGYVHGKYIKLVDQQAASEESPSSAQRAQEEQVTPNDTLPENNVEPVPAEDTTDPEKPTSIVEKDSGLTEAHIATILDNTALSGHGLEKAILEVEDEYGINAFFTIAVMKLESGNGKSKLAKNKNNLFGLNATGSNAHKAAFSFKTKGDSVLKFGQLISKNYINKGYTTVEKISSKYCPANPKWASLVLKIMKSDYKKL
ncbi:glucosaminidase domain-containing protein [Paenibacillus sp. NEAU-GSW1]|uniref:glucosaminidase domain-containing protein n=1 Tax=Paenibacillus sp. NEAU-GSW1 TaxID=2682486 RepID=UPI0012E1B4C1|nr:glucosaminidase domain-containing protein [Paenibacillus sp. NEAU-GSW1]MUT67018.1 hypothetical protein [Paenibacillus sp. NEAU-GSW1]